MSKWGGIGKIALAFAELTIPAVQQVELDVIHLKQSKSGAEKLAAARALVLDGLRATESGLDKDFLNDPQVAISFDEFAGAVVRFHDGLAAAKAAQHPG